MLDACHFFVRLLTYFEQKGESVLMNKSIGFQPVAITLFIALSVSYLLCIAVGLAFDWTMYQSWLPFLPGFT